MAGRIRTIKPELLEDERTAGLTHEAWRLFVSLILIADDYGNFRASTRYLDGAVFWARESQLGADLVLTELVNCGLVLTYQVRGQLYGHLAGWEKHQRIDKPGQPRCPWPEDNESTNENGSRESFANDSGMVPESETELSRLTGTSDQRPPTSDQDPRPGSGAARAARQRRVKPNPDRPVVMSADWRPPDSTFEAQATKWEVTTADLEKTLPEFRDYWTRTGNRKGQRGWIQTWVNRISFLAKRNELHIDRRRLIPGNSRPIANRSEASVANAMAVVSKYEAEEHTQ
jgi:hypothetical protein